MEQPIVSAVTHSENDVVFTLSDIPDRPGVAALIFDAKFIRRWGDEIQPGGNMLELNVDRQTIPRQTRLRDFDGPPRDARAAQQAKRRLRAAKAQQNVGFAAVVNRIAQRQVQRRDHRDVRQSSGASSCRRGA